MSGDCSRRPAYVVGLVCLRILTVHTHTAMSPYAECGLGRVTYLTREREAVLGVSSTVLVRVLEPRNEGGGAV